MTFARSPLTSAVTLSFCAGLSTLALFAVVAPEARADDTLSCKDRVVSIGDSKYDVSALCGAPDWVERRVETRAVRRPVTVPCRVAAGVTRCEAVVDDAVDVQIEEWTYDFGPDRFIEYLTFEQGKLLQMHTGNYGHKT